MVIRGRIQEDRILEAVVPPQISFDRKRTSLPLDSAVAVSLWILFPFEAPGISLQSFLHRRRIDTEVGSFEFLNHFRKMEQMTLRGSFQHAQRARHEKTTLQCDPSGRALIQQYLISVNFLRQTDGFCFAPPQYQALIDSVRGSD